MSNRITEENMEGENPRITNEEEEEVVVSDKKGGLRTMPFIIANESFERVASIGLMPNMILYLINGYHLDMVPASVILSIWSASSDTLGLLGAFISDSYFGRFRIIAFGSFASLIGMTLLWLTAMIPQAKPPPCESSLTGCQKPTFAQLALLVSSFCFMSIGAGCIRPCSIAFGADQLVKKGDPEKNERVVDSYFNWYYASIGVSTIVALTVVVYIQDNLGMKVGFGIPAILMLLSALFFLVGSSLYVKKKAHESFFTGLAQVLVAAFKNRHIVYPPDNSDEIYYHGKNSNFGAPSEKLRFLNKACVIEDPGENLNYDGSAANPWRLCSVEHVEGLKALISVIPIWSTGIMAFLTLNSLTVLQASSMDRHVTSNFQIPAGSFTLFTVLTVTIWVAFYNQVVTPLVKKYSGRSHGINPTLRMGIGLIVSSITMALAAILESIRRKIAIEEGLADDTTRAVSMSAMWLIPQYCLAGFAEGLNAVGQIEYYYSQLPKSMSSWAMALFSLGTACSSLLSSLIVTIVNNITGSRGNISWLSTNLNKGHYDYYYGLLAFLSMLNFIYYIICCRACGPGSVAGAGGSKEGKDLEETLLSKTRERPGTSSA